MPRKKRLTKIEKENFAMREKICELNTQIHRLTEGVKHEERRCNIYIEKAENADRLSKNTIENAKSIMVCIGQIAGEPCRSENDGVMHWSASDDKAAMERPEPEYNPVKELVDVSNDLGDLEGKMSAIRVIVRRFTSK